MSTIIKITDGVNEMLFSNRNKAYGAYVIRVTYVDALIKSLVTVVGVVAVTAGIGYLLTGGGVDIQEPLSMEGTQVTTTVTIVPPEVEKQKVEQPKEAASIKSNPMATQIKEEAPTENSATQETAQPVGTPDGKGTIPTLTNGKDTSVVVQPVIEEPKKPIYDPDVHPEFPGGLLGLKKYLMEKLRYPEDAVAIGKKGTVHVAFIIEPDGSVNQVKILRGIGAGCDEEAARVVGAMPKWKPGVKNGEKVGVWFNLPIKFEIQN